MPNRQRVLLFGLIAAVVAWQGFSLIGSWILGPIESRQADVDRLQANVTAKDDQVFELLKTAKRLKDWQAMSLPPDPPSANKRAIAGAVLAQRLYQEWVLDLANICGFEELSVKPGATRSKGNVYVSVFVKVEAEARHEQLCRFLDQFERTALLQRVSQLKIESRESEGDPVFKVVIDVEGLTLINAPQRKTLFPRGRLVKSLDDAEETLEVADAGDFPKKPGFTVRMGTELAEVTGIAGAVWTIRRGQERTQAAAHAEGLVVELQPRRTDRPARSEEQWNELLASSIFVKPAPPTEYRLKIAPPGEKIAMRGKSVDFTLSATGFNLSQGRPEFVLAESKLAGLSVEKSTGKVTWKPADDLKAGKYSANVEVRHPSAAGGKLLQKLDLVLRDPNTPPKRDGSPTPTVYLGRAWRYKPPVTDAESGREQLKVVLGENPPEGLTYDEATGEIVWTPPESMKPGDVTVTVVVTDAGDPAETATVALPVKVADDYAQFTYLVGVVARDDAKEAWLYDRSRDQRTILRAGEEFDVSGIAGTVESISGGAIAVRLPGGRKELLLGQNLRDLDEAPVLPEPRDPMSPADAGQPANVPASGASLRAAAL
ncbi:MAG TPA: putative Ig domain-containing protein [Planctomycetaceae bacterium]|nr:putative Ig domain-containing protein [Planctomycetaceae bacterium]